MLHVILVALLPAAVALVSPHSAAVIPAIAFQTAQSDSQAERPGTAEAEFPEMRASIVDRDGDQFVAKTEAGDEFRLPVEGAPPDTNIGDVLRLVPDPDTQTMNVFKADPTGAVEEENPASQL